MVAVGGWAVGRELVRVTLGVAWLIPWLSSETRDRHRSATVPGCGGGYFVYPSSLFAAITYWLVYVPARLIGCGALPMNFSIVYTVGGPLAGIIPSGRN